jgi:DNA-binding GntR family transcriptional regulator
LSSTTSTTKQIKRNSTDVSTIAGLLRSAIVAGEYVPNQRLVESDLSEQYGASRATVRAALADLANEGLVERIQNRGSRVRAVSLDEAIEITEIRAALESLCAAKAAERITDAEKVELAQLGEDMRQAVLSGYLMEYSDANKRLHSRIVEISQQRTAATTLSRLRAQSVRHQYKLALQSGRPAVSLPEHLAIIEAVCSGDPARAHDVVEAHLLSVINALRDSQNG